MPERQLLLWLWRQGDSAEPYQQKGEAASPLHARGALVGISLLLGHNDTPAPTSEVHWSFSANRPVDAERSRMIGSRR